MAASIEVKVPDIGDFKDVAVIELLVKPGDRVAVDQSLITVESDKASMEIPSSAAGIVKELKVKLGDKVNQGSTVLLLEADGAAAPAPAAKSAAAAAAACTCCGCRCAGGGERIRERTCCRVVRRRGRPRVRPAGAGRRPGWLLGRVSRGRPRHEGGARRALRHAGWRVPERRLHSVEGVAARGRGHGRGGPLRRSRRGVRRAERGRRQAARAQEQGGGQADRRSVGHGTDAQGHGGARLRQLR